MVQRIRQVATRTDLEAVELSVLNSKIQANRSKQEADQLRDVCRVIYKALSASEEKREANKNRLKRKKRSHHRQMRRLFNRVCLCLLMGFIVLLSWWLKLVTAEFLLGVALICSLVVSYTVGAGKEKEKQFGGVMRSYCQKAKNNTRR